MALLKKRLADILSNKTKLVPISPIGTLSREDSSVLVAMSAAVEKFQEDVIFELAETAMHGVALTLMQFYNNGLPHGAQLQNPTIQRLAEVVAKAGEDARKCD
jgi:hypothetical protein